MQRSHSGQLSSSELDLEVLQTLQTGRRLLVSYIYPLFFELRQRGVRSDSDEVYGWIHNGGRLTVQGIGDLSQLFMPKISGVFIERLENMP